MSYFKVRSAFLSGLFVAMAACSPAQQGGETNDTAAEIDSLEGSNWQLVELTVLGGFEFVPDDPDKYVLNFRTGDRLTGRSDCNSLTGSWLQGLTELSFSPFATTRGLCAPGSLHNNLVLYLKDVAAYSFQDSHLVLTTPTEGVKIVFESRD